MARFSDCFFVQRLSDTVRLPTASGGLGGYVLYAPYDLVVPPGGVSLVYTGLAVRIPAAYVGRLSSLQSLVNGHSVFAGAERLDCTCRSELKLLLFNHGYTEFRAAARSPVARLVLERIHFPPVVEVTEL